MFRDYIATLEEAIRSAKLKDANLPVLERPGLLSLSF
jgi:hypothetical protein